MILGPIEATQIFAANGQAGNDRMWSGLLGPNRPVTTTPMVHRSPTPSRMTAAAAGRNPYIYEPDQQVRLMNQFQLMIFMKGSYW